MMPAYQSEGLCFYVSDKFLGHDVKLAQGPHLKMETGNGVFFSLETKKLSTFLESECKGNRTCTSSKAGIECCDMVELCGIHRNNTCIS